MFFSSSPPATLQRAGGDGDLNRKSFVHQVRPLHWPGSTYQRPRHGVGARLGPLRESGCAGAVEPRCPRKPRGAWAWAWNPGCSWELSGWGLKSWKASQGWKLSQLPLPRNWGVLYRLGHESRKQGATLEGECPLSVPPGYSLKPSRPSGAALWDSSALRGVSPGQLNGEDGGGV